MAREEEPVIKEPPWVWGPSEVNAWIESAYPSKRRGTGRVRTGPETITRLRVVAETSALKDVRTATAEALTRVGLEITKSAEGSHRRPVLARFRRSLAGSRVHVSLHFDPPIHVSSCKRIVKQLSNRFDVVAVTAHKARTRLPPRSE